MEQLNNAGNGSYTCIDSEKTAERFFVYAFTGTLETIAEDVKFQVDWSKDPVTRYGLVGGSTNRGHANKDFRNYKRDAHEIGAGYAVTALFEIELATPSFTP